LKPARFEYPAPATVDEGIEILRSYGDDAKVLAGGQSLVPMMNMRLAQPQALVDIARIPQLAGIGLGEDSLRIGAATRQSDVLRSPEARTASPLIPAAMRWVGHEANRNRGTFGGSAAHADPSAEIPAILVALEATLVARGPAGERSIAASDFFQSYFETALAPDEILIEVRIPRYDTGRTRWAFTEFAQRHGDFALAGVAAVVSLDEGGLVQESRFVLMGVSDVPTEAGALAAALRGRALGGDVVSLAPHALEGIEPTSDLQATAEYRRRATQVLVRRVLEQLSRPEEDGDRHG
jgi:carbon-monoxide dehydrogenase medium subunit